MDATNNTAYRLRRLAEERAVTLTPKHFSPAQPPASPLPLKSHPALALSAAPPPVPAPGPFSPVSTAAARGFSRSQAGAPWGESADSLRSDNQRPRSVQWTPFRTESGSRFVTDVGHARALNHQRLTLEANSSSGKPYPSIPHFGSINQRP